MNPARRINRSPQGRAPRAIARAALPAAAILAMMLPALAPSAARAQTYDQNGTVVVGNGGGGVSVDLSVLNDLGPSPRRSLRFPGTEAQPGTPIHLHPPTVQLRPPHRRTRRTARKAPTERPPRRPAAPAATAESAPPAAPPPPPKVATAPPMPMTAPPATSPSTSSSASPAPAPAPASPSQSTAKSAAKTEAKAAPAVPAMPSLDRNAVPPPPLPVPESSSTKSSPMSTTPQSEMPPVTPAPRESVTSVPPPPPATKAPSQTASLPPASTPTPTPGTATGFAPNVVHAIAFGSGKATLDKAGEKTLAAAARALDKDSALRVELQAYAAGDKSDESRARRLSLSRALAVRSFLINKGVQATRIDVRALGSNVPSGSPDRVDVTLVTR